MGRCESNSLLKWSSANAPGPFPSHVQLPHSARICLTSHWSPPCALTGSLNQPYKPNSRGAGSNSDPASGRYPVPGQTWPIRAFPTVQVKILLLFCSIQAQANTLLAFLGASPFSNPLRHDRFVTVQSPTTLSACRRGGTRLNARTVVDESRHSVAEAVKVPGGDDNLPITQWMGFIQPPTNTSIPSKI